VIIAGAKILFKPRINVVKKKKLKCFFEGKRNSNVFFLKRRNSNAKERYMYM
jgi:hypothetical protein